jgi:threonine aldolase
MVQPKMVYISNSTELGTIYSKAELTAIHDICRQNGLILFLDGARIGSAVMAKTNDLSLEDIAGLVDIFYIGGTKNGALLGEALVICRDDLKKDFRYLIKQRGALMAKGFVIGIQFEALFQDELFYQLADHANKMAEMVAGALKKYGYSFYVEPCTNQLFPIIPNSIMGKLSDEFEFFVQERINQDETVIRLVTSWATTQESVDSLTEFLSRYRLDG